MFLSSLNWTFCALVVQTDMQILLRFLLNKAQGGLVIHVNLSVLRVQQSRSKRSQEETGNISIGVGRADSSEWGKWLFRVEED